MTDPRPADDPNQASTLSSGGHQQEEERDAGQWVHGDELLTRRWKRQARPAGRDSWKRFVGTSCSSWKKEMHATGYSVSTAISSCSSQPHFRKKRTRTVFTRTTVTFQDYVIKVTKLKHFCLDFVFRSGKERQAWNPQLMAEPDAMETTINNASHFEVLPIHGQVCWRAFKCVTWNVQQTYPCKARLSPSSCAVFMTSHPCWSLLFSDNTFLSDLCAVLFNAPWKNNSVQKWLNEG